MIEGSIIQERVAENGDDEPLRAAIYARTSSTTQEYGYSLDAQVSRSADRCEALGWEVRFIYRDEAQSGKDTDRPMFQTMLDVAKQDAIDVIVFWKLDRFSRSLIHAVKLEKELREHDVALYSITEQIDTTSATGRFNFRNLASAAEFERDMIKQRTELSLNELAADYKWPNGNPPLGYELNAENKLEIVEEEKELVTRIFEMYIELRSMPEVADALNDKCIETADGGEWTPRAVGDILRNEIYKGQYEVGDVSEYVADYQLIDSSMFEEVTSIRMRFQQNGNNRPTMADSRKEKIVHRMCEMYRTYLNNNRQKGIKNIT